jgi:hypothetical protein
VRLNAVPPQPPESSSDSTSAPASSSRTSIRPAEAGPSQPPPSGIAGTILGEPEAARSSTPTSPSMNTNNTPIELEAVVSCTSDGLVVILRRARPLIPGTVSDPLRTGQAVAPTQPIHYPRGTFAAPWAPEPVFIPDQPRPAQPGWYHGMHPQYVQPMPVPSGPSPQDFMNSIREVAVFAWGLVGINGNLAEYGRGDPVGHSQPPEGFPVWEPHTIDSGNVTQTTSPDPFGQSGPGAGRDGFARG